MKLIAGTMIGGGLVLAAWALSRLSTDAVALMVGVVLGVVAIVPAIMLVVAASRSTSSGAHYYGLQDSDHIHMQGDGLDGEWARGSSNPIVIVCQPQLQPAPQPAPQTERQFAVHWQNENAPVTNVTRWAAPVDGVVLAAGTERERRPVWTTEPVASALASSGLCLVRADEWDAWQHQNGGA